MLRLNAERWGAAQQWNEWNGLCVRPDEAGIRFRILRRIMGGSAIGEKGSRSSRLMS